MMQNKKNNSVKKNKCKKIKIILTDVDGVLTDGGRYYSDKGEILKKFHVRDGMGVNLLLRNGIKTIIVTKENSKIIKKWAREMNITKIISGSLKKENELSKICKKFNVSENEVAYIGDDINDLGLLEKVGFSAVPNDASNMIKKHVDYVCSKDGGRGAFREISDLIIFSNFLTSLDVAKFETRIPLLFMAARVPTTRLPPIVITSTLVSSASEIDSKSSFGIPGGTKVKTSLVLQKTPEYGLLKRSL